MPDDNDKIINSLDPDNFKANLIFASLYIATFESFKDSVIERVKTYYQRGFVDGK